MQKLLPRTELPSCNHGHPYAAKGGPTTDCSLAAWIGATIHSPSIEPARPELRCPKRTIAIVAISNCQTWRSLRTLNASEIATTIARRCVEN